MQCVFCAIASGELSPQVLAHRDERTAVFPSLPQQPRNQGHMLVVPTSHVAHIYGVTIRQNNEPHGGQDVFHVHFHVIPRFAGDWFDEGEDRFPLGAREVSIDDRIRQAAAVRDALVRR